MNLELGWSCVPRTNGKCSENMPLEKNGVWVGGKFLHTELTDFAFLVGGGFTTLDKKVYYFYSNRKGPVMLWWLFLKNAWCDSIYGICNYTYGIKKKDIWKLWINLVTDRNNRGVDFQKLLLGREIEKEFSRKTFNSVNIFSAELGGGRV